MAWIYAAMCFIFWTIFVDLILQMYGRLSDGSVIFREDDSKAYTFVAMCLIIICFIWSKKSRTLLTGKFFKLFWPRRS